MEAVLAQTTGFFQERPADRRLAATFASVWVHRMRDRDAPPVLITPDATIDLQWIDGRFRIAGPDREPQIETLPSGATIVGLRFRPGAAAGWLGVPANRILGERLDLGDLWGVRARHLAGNVRATPDLASMVGQLEKAIGAYTQNQHAPDTVMGFAFDVIDRGLPADKPLVPFLLRTLHMSERTLRRRFEESFGYGPKTLDRILRFHRYRRLRQTSGDASTAVLAVEAGYSDQAHLIRESRRLSGVTPSALADASSRR
ncbi:transcriptional regulator [Mesorhizobium sp. SEMIA 3007]|uniref:AraC family transcriptional regulator n=1 Tax=Mesorhizobium TaxID=68287 RepID=UPI0003748E14|nr:MULTISPECIES: AraC family transcriptional regulator [Mesorhizobium]AID29141.1 helix-turn-helix domain-containing protein [Mesorhizobium huakuii 7653R]ANN59975.1 transcriptional regulator [Mesorhizobium loti NZP2037]MCH4557234.1 AraC family transcriptional regulator [Mesorhizobium jarvisii]ODA94450.1 transcriptional regulator [Mesorhizobium sp. SEMIA 3007]